MGADDPATTHYDVVVSGMGIGGLVSAYEAILAGQQNILMISNRSSDFVRTQRTVLKLELEMFAEHNRIYLQEMIPQGNPIKQLAKALYKIEDPDTVEAVMTSVNHLPQERFQLIQMLTIPPEQQSTIKECLSQIENTPENYQDLQMLCGLEKDISTSLKDIERYLKRRVDEAAKEHKINMEYLQHHQLERVNLTRGEASIFSVQKKGSIKKVTFTYLLGADGSRHHALDLVNQGFNSPLIQHRKDEVQFHEHNISAYIRVKRKDGLTLVLPEIVEKLEDDSEIKAVKEFYINNDGLVSIFGIDRSSYIKSQKTSFKTNFVSEIPSNLIEFSSSGELTASDKENMISFIREKVTKALVEAGMQEAELEVSLVKPSRKHGLAKDKVKLLFFSAHPQTAEKSAVCSNGHYFILVGDAFRSAFYPLGHGAYDAISYGRYTGEVLKGHSIEEYNEICMELADKIREEVSKFQNEKEKALEEHKKNIREAEVYLAIKNKP